MPPTRLTVNGRRHPVEAGRAWPGSRALPARRGATSATSGKRVQPLPFPPGACA